MRVPKDDKYNFIFHADRVEFINRAFKDVFIREFRLCDF